MTVIDKTALLSYSAEAVYNLVNDIPAYPEYIEGCVGSEVLQSEPNFMIARLDLSKGGVKQSFTTKNRLLPYERIGLSLVDGPFIYFDGEWVFTPLQADACKVSFHLEFEVSNPLIGMAANRLLSSVSNNLVSSICSRAKQIYG